MFNANTLRPSVVAPSIAREGLGEEHRTPPKSACPLVLIDLDVVHPPSIRFVARHPEPEDTDILAVDDDTADVLTVGE